jgi:hypothetical protein
VSFRHVPVGSSEGRDVVIARAAADPLLWSSPKETTLARCDTIVNDASGDPIGIEGRNTGKICTNFLGVIESLAYANMVGLFNDFRLPASDAAAFTLSAIGGIFVAWSFGLG